MGTPNLPSPPGPGESFLLGPEVAGPLKGEMQAPAVAHRDDQHAAFALGVRREEPLASFADAAAKGPLMFVA